MTATFNPVTGEVTVTPRQITPQQVLADLDQQGREMNALSNGLAYICRELDHAPPGEQSISEQYRRFVDDFELGLYDKADNEDGFKLPSEAMRLKLAHRAMDPALYGRYFALVRSRERITARVSSLGKVIEGNRTLMSAMKAGIEPGPDPAVDPQTFGRRGAA
jgi:hypothetical protein